MTLFLARHRRAALVALVFLGLAIPATRPAAVDAGQASSQAPSLPVRLADREFWRLIEDMSEPNGFFRSDNLVSNEDTFQYVIPRLAQIVKPGGVYLGVGPDQNFTYIAALAPRMAFITDIRRGNLHAHLMYKALFELAVDRVDFMARLFARPRPAGVGTTSTAEQLFDAFAMLPSSEKLYEQNLRAIVDTLRKKHGFPLDQPDESGIAYVYSAFYSMGPFLAYSSGGMPRGSRYPSYQDLQMADDGRNVQWGYLANEVHFRTVKWMQQNNLIVPIVGDFAGPKALRAVGAYVRERGGTVTTFYTSNVEQYLFQGNVWDGFARNLASLPLDPSSTLLRSCFSGQCRLPGGARSVTMLDSIQALVRDHQAGRVLNYVDVLSRTR